MADRSPDPAPPPVPRWVKVFAAVAAVLVVAFAAWHLSGGGMRHGGGHGLGTAQS